MTAARLKPVARLEDRAYLAWIKTLPCTVSQGFECDAHHLTLGRRRMGRKADDDLVVPLRPEFHRPDFASSVHAVGEATFWDKFGLDPFSIASDLRVIYLEYDGDPELVERVMRGHHAAAAHFRATPFRRFA